MRSYLYRVATSEKRKVVLGVIAIVIGVAVMEARHLDDWTSSLVEGQEAPLNFLRTLRRRVRFS